MTSRPATHVTTVDRHDHARGETCGCKVYHRLGGFPDIADTVQQRKASKGVDLRIPIQRCPDNARGNRIHSDVVGGEFTGKQQG